MSLRDELYKKYGTSFQSSFSDKGTLKFDKDFKFPLGSEGVALYQDFFFQLQDELRFHMLLDICLEEKNGKRVLYYQFLNLEVFFCLQVVVDLGESMFFPSLSSLWSSAASFEADIIRHHDILLSDGSRTEQRQALDAFYRAKQLQDQSTGDLGIAELPQYHVPLSATSAQKERVWRRYGPHSRPFHGKVRSDLLVGEGRVFDSKIHHGLHFRDIERKAIHKNPFQLIFTFERLCMRDSIFAPLLWVETIEGIHGITIPDKAKAIRMVWMELARVEGHLNFLWELTQELGFYVEASVFAELLEQIYHLYNLYSGKSQNFSIFTFGGLKKSNPLGWGTECLEVAKYLFKVIEDQQKEFNRNPRWMEMTRGFSMSATTALDYGYTGPNLRACGVNFDTRKTQPRYFYDDVDFEVPLGIDGTTYDRFLVRIEELKQSLRIINQVLDHLPAGDVLNRQHGLYHPAFDDKATEFSNHVPFGSWPQDSMNSFTTIESTEGQLGLFLGLDHGRLSHLHIRSPSLAHLGAFDQLVKGGAIHGVFTAFQSLSIDAWEMDR